MHLPAPLPSGMLIRAAQQSTQKVCLIIGHTGLCHEHKRFSSSTFLQSIVVRYI